MTRRPAARLWALAALALFAACASLRLDPNEPLVDLAEVDGAIRLDIRYATKNNFTGKILYPADRCLLRRSVAKRLSLVQSELSGSRLGLKVWDCYRPLSVQRKLWQLVPDPRYVADPKTGSRHNRGAAVDVTLVFLSGQELPMPTGYDDFSKSAHRNYMGGSSESLRNRDILRDAMERHGFVGLPTEWWHFDAKGWRRYPILDAPLEPSRPAGPRK